MDESICGNCRFWRPKEDKREGKACAGECHKGPPIVAVAAIKDRWPATFDDEDCGEFKVKKG
jgi:hypothetical protein